MTKPEVLSPVGNEQMLQAAVRAGADAVYFGMGNFNARRNARNFDRAAFAQAVRYCHVRDVRVYLTLNTLVSDEEVCRALSDAAFAYENGVDAVIVQDLGLAYKLHELMPDLKLHASTLMTVHSPSALPTLKKLGFSQVVVSREISRDELKVFCEEAKRHQIRVEVFVHGALCMSMSGQCYLSAVLGGRSGNRGLCAGPCRLPFSADRCEAYALSLKDLSLVDHLKELADLGVASFKIEGRMKRPEYVAAATAVCRAKVDGVSCENWEEALRSVFSRSGFTDGYFTARRGSRMFGVRQKEDVLRSDTVFSPIHELYRTERQNVALTAEFVMRRGEPCSLTVTDSKHAVSVFGPIPEDAEARSLTRETVREKLSKTGNTPFYFAVIETLLSDGLFLPASTLNAMRREALESIAEKRAKIDRAPISVVCDAPQSKRRAGKTTLVARFSSLIQVPSDLSDVRAIVLPLEEAWETYEGEAEVIVEVARGLSFQEDVFRRLCEAKKHGVRAAMCTTIGALSLIEAAGLFPLFDFSMNLFSSGSLEAAAVLGAKAAVASFEVTRGQFNRMNGRVPLGLIAYGHLPLMLTRNCPVRSFGGCRDNCGLTDRKGAFFPVRCRNGYSELYNSVPLWLADKLHEFSADFVVLYFTVESSDKCADVLRSYRMSKQPDGGFTRGLYYKGVD